MGTSQFNERTSTQTTSPKELQLKSIELLINTIKNLSEIQTIQLLKQASDCLGGDPHSTMLAMHLIQNLLQRVQNGLNKDDILNLAKKMLPCLECEDNQQRLCVTVALHSLYASNPKHRSELRNLFGASLFLLEGRASGAVLDLLFSIIQGFVMPLKEIHLTFCRTYLIPLLQNSQLPAFYCNLHRCLVHFAVNAPSLSLEILSAVLTRCNPAEEPALTAELFDFALALLPTITPQDYETIQELLFQKMVDLINEGYTELALKPFEDQNTRALILANLSLAQQYFLPALIIRSLTANFTDKCELVLELLQKNSL